MKERLQKRLKHREKSMIEHQDQELKTLMNSNKTAAKIKRSLLTHNHLVAMEKMKYLAYTSFQSKNSQS